MQRSHIAPEYIYIHIYIYYIYVIVILPAAVVYQEYMRRLFN